jgi:pimeloyl-ACP methyl ester carboxylesterase
MSIEEARAETFAAHDVSAADGLRLSVRDYPAVAPANGLPVICLHGLTRNARDFELVAPRVAALGRRVLALDVRGRGASARDPDASHYAAPVYVQDVLTVLDALHTPRAVFLGTSMGGIITMALAAAAPERIAAAILNDIGPVLETAGLERIAAYVGKTMDYETVAAAIAAIKAGQAPAYPDRDDQFWRAFLRRIARIEADGRVRLDYDPAIANAFAGGAAPADMSPLFEALAKAPVLSIRGALSDLLSPDGVARMRALKPTLVSVEIPNVGHAPTLEEPEAWNAIVDFLAVVD